VSFSSSFLLLSKNYSTKQIIIKTNPKNAVLCFFFNSCFFFFLTKKMRRQILFQKNMQKIETNCFLKVHTRKKRREILKNKECVFLNNKLLNKMSTTPYESIPENWRAAMKAEPELHEIECKRAAIYGGGAFGTALATMIARKGGQAMVWVRDPEQATKVNESRKNEKYLPDFELEPNITFTSSTKEACEGAQIILLALPTPFVRAFLVQNRDTFPPGVPIVLAAKGIEVGSLQTPFEIVRDELPGKYNRMIAIISGPSFAKEMMKGQPTNVAIGAEDPQVAFNCAKLLSSRTARFRCYASPDFMGMEIAGAVKNCVAIAAGAADGLGFTNNARSGLLCRALAEMKRLALACGSTGACLPGLAGTGDLFLTCSSPLSRNFSVGARIAKGEKVDVEAGIGAGGSAGVAEGVLTAKSIYQLCQSKKIHMPICHEVYLVLYEGKALQDAFKALMDRPLSVE
jgi:glycerol-3-phosphate dehydrogenase (NAD(P)+)